MPTCFQNAILTQLDPPKVEPGNLRQSNGQIVALGPKVAAEPGDEIVDCQGAVLMPGLVNGHTHLYSVLAAGMPPPPRQPKNFHEILQLIWWPLDRTHSLESVEVSSQIGALAALRCGTTTLVDHHASPNAIDGSLTALQQGIATVGCRAVLCYEVTDRNHADEARQGIEENRRYLQACQANKTGQFAGMVGAHASFTLEEDSLAACAELAQQQEVGLHIHVAEDPVDETITRERFQCGLLERFARHGLLDTAGTIFAHCTHLSAAEFQTLDQHQASLTLAHNPNSNMNNGVGYTPVAQLNKLPMLGTDGIGADMWREARTAQFKSNDAGLPLVFGAPLAMLAQSARQASACLGTKLGVLEDGAAADLVVTDYHPATPLTANNLAGHFLYAMGPEFVRHVFIAGRCCLQDRQVLTCDEPALRNNSTKVATALHKNLSRAH